MKAPAKLQLFGTCSLEFVLELGTWDLELWLTTDLCPMNDLKLTQPYCAYETIIHPVRQRSPHSDAGICR
jgi:hypothetical protein